MPGVRGGSTTSGGALVKTSVQLTPDQLDALTVLARRGHTPIGVLIRQMIDDGLDRERESGRLPEVSEVA